MSRLPLQKNGEPFPVYVVSSNELLLRNECVDELRSLMRDKGVAERSKFSVPGSGVWQQAAQEAQNISLFATKKLIEIDISGGKPGREGADMLVSLCEQAVGNQLVDVYLIIILPKLDRATQNTKWAKALWQKAQVIDIPEVTASQLPAWIAARLKQQNQTVNAETLQFISQQVEGNLLAAQQEILKLGLSFPEGHISQADIEQAIEDVARFNVFSLSNAILSGNSSQTSRIIRGLEAEGEPLPLVLGVILRDIRDLYQLAQVRDSGQPLGPAFKQLRIFGNRQQLLNRALQRMSFKTLMGLLQHAHDVDRMFKGIPVDRRLNNAWAELLKLGLRAAA